MEFETGNFKLARRRAVTQVEALDAVLFAQTKTFHRTMRDVEQRGQVWIITVGQELPVAGDKVDQALKGGLDGAEVFKNIRVIKFQVVEDDDFREVMDKFAALVKKSRVIFVALNDEPGAV